MEAKATGVRADMPAAVYDRVRARVVLIYQSGNYFQPDAKGSCGISQRTSHIGWRWSRATCLDAALPAKLRPHPDVLSPGPGAGLQLPSGRLLFALHSSFKRAMVVWSDTGGDSWTRNNSMCLGLPKIHEPPCPLMFVSTQE